MKRLPLANREEELALFDAMVAGTTSERILLLEARGKLGKSTLVKEFVRRCPNDMTCVPVDLKGDPGLHEVLARLCDGLGWEGFPALTTRVEELGRDGGRRAADAARFEHVPRENYPLAAIRNLIWARPTASGAWATCTGCWPNTPRRGPAMRKRAPSTPPSATAWARPTA